MVSVGGIAAGSVVAVMVAQIVGLCCLKYKIKKHKDQLGEKFDEARGMPS